MHTVTQFFGHRSAGLLPCALYGATLEDYSGATTSTECSGATVLEALKAEGPNFSRLAARGRHGVACMRAHYAGSSASTHMMLGVGLVPMPHWATASENGGECVHMCVHWPAIHVAGGQEATAQWWVRPTGWGPLKVVCITPLLRKLHSLPICF